MLGKLIKYEWKSTYKMGGLMLILLAGITFFGWLAFRSPMWRTFNADDYSYHYNAAVGILDIMSVFTLLLYVILLVASAIGIVIYLAVHFYQTMYTDEGYLLHTLPVAKGQLMFSKILISGAWLLIVMLAVYLSAAGLVSFMVGAVLPEEHSVWEVWKWIFGGMGDAVRMLERSMNFNAVFYLVYCVLALLISPFVTVTILFGAISMGQLFTKHRALMAIVCYGGVWLANGLMSSLLEAIITTTHIRGRFNEVFKSYVDINLVSGSILNILFAVAMYLVAYYVNTKRLNME